jgi:hypothetical protein
MDATHFLMKTLPQIATEMALHVLAYNLTRVINITGVQLVLAAMRARLPPTYGCPPMKNPQSFAHDQGR